MIVPTTRSRSPEAARSVLTSVPGLGEGPVLLDAAGGFVNAEPSLGSGPFRVGPDLDTTLSGLMIAPSELDGLETAPGDAGVPEVAARRAHVVAAGADAVGARGDQPHGVARVPCGDSEGHLRTLGDGDPRARG